MFLLCFAVVIGKEWNESISSKIKRRVELFGEITV